MVKPGKSGISRIIDATRYSAQGIRQAWRHEAAFRQESILTLILLPAGLSLGRTAIERTLLIGCCLLVLIVELLNSAIEAAVDRHGDEHHELSGRAKDLGSAAVFISLVVVLIVWSAVAYQRFSSPL